LIREPKEKGNTFKITVIASHSYTKGYCFKFFVFNYYLKYWINLIEVSFSNNVDDTPILAMLLHDCPQPAVSIVFVALSG
jgi:hypothetical protein